MESFNANFDMLFHDLFCQINLWKKQIKNFARVRPIIKIFVNIISEKDGFKSSNPKVRLEAEFKKKFGKKIY